MDTSETYIKMSDCEEIQSRWIPSNGDFTLRFKHNRGIVEVHHNRELTAYFDKSDYIWLPRQDQLQEMVVQYPDDEPWVTFTSLRDFVMEAPITRSRNTEQFKSWEQLWLAFVMKEKWNKTWDGEHWIDERT